MGSGGMAAVERGHLGHHRRQLLAVEIVPHCVVEPDRAGKPAEIGLQFVAERGLAESPRQDRDHGDADLHRRQQPRRVGLELERRLGTGAALGRQRLQPRPPRRHQRDLRHDEQPVQKNQEK